MDVLVYLAQQPGRVVAQEELYEALWPGTLFNPGSVQRCIAQLRKALGDDARNPTFIKTHPKRGYSLEVTPAIQVAPPRRFAPAIAGAVALVVGLVWLWWPEQNLAKLNGTLTPLTSASAYDFYPRYSPDGKKLAFIRQVQGQSHIWLLNLGTGTKQQVSQQSEDYQSLAWSQNSDNLYFTVRSTQGDWVGKLSLDIAQIRLKQLFRLQEPGDIWRVQPKGSSLYYMHADVPINKAPSTMLKRFDMATGQHQELLSSDNSFTPYRIALSPNKNRIAIAGEDASNGVQVRMFELTSNTLLPAFSTLPLGYTEIDWHPGGEALLVHHLNQLSLLRLDGQQQPLPYRHYQRLFNPAFNPDGRSISLSLTELDTDIYLLPNIGAKAQLLVDSSGEDHLPRLSPQGKALAYVSSRSGTQQLYLKQNGQERLLFANPDNLPVYRAPVWAHDTSQLAYAFGKRLFIHEIELGNTKQIDMPASFTAILDWYQHTNALLISIKQDNVSYLAKYNLSTGEIEKQIQTGVNFHARLDEQDNLVYAKDGMLHWGQSSFDITTLPEPNSQFFPVGSALLYQSGNGIWQFDGEQASLLMPRLPNNTHDIADINASGAMLLYSAPEEKAKIVELR